MVDVVASSDGGAARQSLRSGHSVPVGCPPLRRGHAGVPGEAGGCRHQHHVRGHVCGSLTGKRLTPSVVGLQSHGERTRRAHLPRQTNLQVRRMNSS